MHVVLLIRWAVVPHATVHLVVPTAVEGDAHAAVSISSAVLDEPIVFDAWPPSSLVHVPVLLHQLVLV